MRENSQPLRGGTHDGFRLFLSTCGGGDYPVGLNLCCRRNRLDQSRDDRRRQRRVLQEPHRRHPLAIPSSRTPRSATWTSTPSGSRSARRCAARSAKALGANPKIEATLDRREALRGRGLRHQHGADRRVRLDAGRLRDPAEVRPELHHRRHDRPRRAVPRAADVSDAHGPVPRHGGAVPAGACCSTTPTR